MSGLVSLIAKLSLECCGMRHHELFTIPPENNARPSVLNIVLHVDLMPVICLLGRSSSSVVVATRPQMVCAAVHQCHPWISNADTHSTNGGFITE